MAHQRRGRFYKLFSGFETHLPLVFDLILFLVFSSFATIPTTIGESPRVSSHVRPCGVQVSATRYGSFRCGGVGPFLVTMLMADHYIISCQQDHLASLLCLSTVYPLLSNACAAPPSYWILVAFHCFRYIRILLVQNDGMDLHRPGLTWPFFLRCFGFSFPRSPRPRRDTCFPSIRLPIRFGHSIHHLCLFFSLSFRLRHLPSCGCCCVPLFFVPFHPSSTGGIKAFLLLLISFEVASTRKRLASFFPPFS